MNRCIAIDCGKYNTKACAYDPETASIRELRFRTKISEGTFIDDMFDRGTMIVQVDDGPVYKIGNGAKEEPSMETNKKTEIHRICTLASIALLSQPGSNPNLNVVIGMPLDIQDIPEERIAYKTFIFDPKHPTHTIKMKTSPTAEVKTVQFTIANSFVYPEGMGVLYDYAGNNEEADLSGAIGIIDIGNLNTNNIYTIDGMVVNEKSFTSELGGKRMILGLAQQLSAVLGSRVSENIVASALLKPEDQRCLTPNIRKTGDEAVTKKITEIQDKSRKEINKYLLEHTRAIKGLCDSKQWDLDWMQLICIGGTSKLISAELKKTFGDNILIPDEPEFINVRGFLTRLCTATAATAEDYAAYAKARDTKKSK